MQEQLLTSNNEYARVFVRWLHAIPELRITVPQRTLDRANRVWESIGEKQNVNTSHVLGWLQHSSRIQLADLITPFVVFPASDQPISARITRLQVRVWPDGIVKDTPWLPFHRPNLARDLARETTTILSRSADGLRNILFELIHNGTFRIHYYRNFLTSQESGKVEKPRQYDWRLGILSIIMLPVVRDRRLLAIIMLYSPIPDFVGLYMGANSSSFKKPMLQPLRGLVGSMEPALNYLSESAHEILPKSLNITRSSLILPATASGLLAGANDLSPSEIFDKNMGQRNREGNRIEYRQMRMYEPGELRALKFLSVKDYDRAIDAIFKDPNLRGVPFDTPDGITLFVPNESVQYFRDHRLRFRESVLLDPQKISSKRLAKLRDQFGM